MTTTIDKAVVLEAIEDEIRSIMYEDARYGANDYAYVRVSPDGTVYSGREASYTLTIDEWEGKEPHTVTVWSASRIRAAAGPEDGVFCWDELGSADGCHEDGGRVFRGDDELEGIFVSDGTLYRLTDDLVEEFDLADVMAGIDEQLDEYDWLN